MNLNHQKMICGVNNCHLPPQMRINEDIPTNKVLLAKMREKGYYKVIDFAGAVGVTRAYLSQVLHYKINPDTDLRLRIAKVLDCDSSVIFPIEDEMKYRNEGGRGGS